MVPAGTVVALPLITSIVIVGLVSAATRLKSVSDRGVIDVIPSVSMCITWRPLSPSGLGAATVLTSTKGPVSWMPSTVLTSVISQLLGEAVVA